MQAWRRGSGHQDDKHPSPGGQLPPDISGYEGYLPQLYLAPVQRASDGLKLASEHPQPDKEGDLTWSRQRCECEARDGNRDPADDVENPAEVEPAAIALLAAVVTVLEAVPRLALLELLPASSHSYHNRHLFHRTAR